jgi:hypothetical protein
MSKFDPKEVENKIKKILGLPEDAVLTKEQILAAKAAFIASLPKREAAVHTVTPEYTKKLYSLKVGDKVIRMLAGVRALEVIVGEVTDTTIKVYNKDVPLHEGWTFSRITGAEIDDVIDSKMHLVGGGIISYLKLD